ncbi:hypothetical protein A6V39_03855 [Candidatus Mycoplasma haematobovis]|uniref:Uncharacterized protein n=1 Tax=Candidatus Mycoplasma haematobovis TaxID=432608 RepID=A0A1A9QBR4_9MOLU|nr:hypothetical protein [Candidatus Mycoplasma haematobovis]OAL10022.1 hypothetical protein A6V39_03855 [Candidatus Mycoplasma haematobovis]
MEAYRLATKDTFEDIKPTEINEKILKERCKKAFKKETVLALKWCVKKQNLKTVLKKVGLKVLDESSSEEDWKKLINEVYDNDSSVTIDELKRHCNGFGDAFTVADEFIDKYTIADSEYSIKE